MKFKRLILSATAVAASSSLLATVLTSCSKADIDEDLIIDLDDNGLFGTVGSKNFDYKSAIKAALTRSSGWKTFKEALADEIVYQWYENRASKTTKSHDKNDKFRDNLEEWKYKSNKEYDEIVDKCKSSYGANYKFYLQNEYLSQYGGTKDSYIHSKMVAHVKEEFTKAVFADNFFGIRTGTEDADYPQILTEAKNSVDFAPLNNPANWSKLGFYAKTKVGFEPVKPENDPTWPLYLAAHPEGDYATIQDYVFNRWFEDEKPFFSAAALFKYSNPTTSGSALSDIYNPNRATLPTDGPNEAFPFFGGIAINSNEGEKGVHAYWDWYWNLYNGVFEAPGMYDDGTSEKWNQTITIPKTSTDDSQTLLLCTANDMFNTLYTPYAVAAANLYGRMFSANGATVALNKYTQLELQDNVAPEDERPQDQDDDSILRNFFRTAEPDDDTIGSYLDLNDIHKVDNPDTEYHYPLFTDNKFFKYFYGGDDGLHGVRFIINNLEADLGKWDGTSPKTTPVFIDQQPWALELNQSGMHAQTIDGYLYVRGTSASTADQKMQRLKEVFKYRVMQKYCNYDGGLISCDLFSTDGAGRLEKYFTEHFADIILELAMKDATDPSTNKYKVFRTIESYAKTTTFADTDLFLYKINLDEEFVLAGSYSDLTGYLAKTIDIDWKKKVISSVEAINDKIYSYRSAQIENSKDNVGKKRFENGLLGRMPLVFENKPDFRSARYYSVAIDAIFGKTEDKHFLTNGETGLLNQYKDKILSGEDIKDVFVAFEASVGQNTNFGFSPQIKDAKKVMSNRFWYKSAIVDKLMYAFMADKGNANAIKEATYEAYDNKVFPSDTGKPSLDTIIKADADADYYNRAFYSTYIKSKLFSGDKNFSSYAQNASASFYTTMEPAYERLQQSYLVENGASNDEAVSLQLFISTIAYLSKADSSGNYFANFYKWLDSKILNNETAYVGYLKQFSTYHEPTDINKKLIYTDLTGKTPYDWSGKVDNIFDHLGYAGNTGADDFSVASSTYWNVVNKRFPNATKTYAGFTGLQTAKNNIFDGDSGLQAAAFGSDDGLHNFAQSTWQSPILTSTGGEHAQNDGALFPWAGSYTGAAFEWANPAATSEKVTSADIADVNPQALRLGHMIYEMDNKDDLLELATKLANAIYGRSMFRDIVSGEIEFYRPKLTDSIKYYMLKAIVEKDELTNAPKWTEAFNRVRNVELHTDISQGTRKYAFRNGSNGYRVMLTQINKADVTEKLLTPKLNAAGTAWEMDVTSPLTIEEFWFMLCSAACDTSNQQLATADAVKEIFGEPKLQVFDAQLYNQFDSVWIKDWVKKPIGGGSE